MIFILNKQLTDVHFYTYISYLTCKIVRKNNLDILKMN